MMSIATPPDLHESPQVGVFLKASSNVLEISPYTLRGTGVAATLCAFCHDYVGDEQFKDWMAQLAELPSDPLAKQQAMHRLLNDEFYGPITRNLQIVWYIGSWMPLPDSWQQRHAPDKPNVEVVVSAQTYQEGLIWPLIDAHPPGAKQQGWAVWSRPPLRPTPG